MINTYKVLVGKSEESLGDLGIELRIILTQVLNK
jgi:hypothetical protein